MSKITKLIIVLYLALCVFCGRAKSESSPPKIKDVASDEKTVDSNTDLTLICEGDEKITWTYPNRIKEKINVLISEINGKYLAELTLQNMAFTDVDYYYCHAENAAKDDEERSAKVYVFVEDEDNLSVLPSEETVDVYASQHSTVVLPCRPTSSDISVKLFDTNGVEVPSYSYDKHIGFTITTHAFDSQYLCKFQRDEEESVLTVHVAIEMKPTIYNAYKNEATLKVLSGQSIYLYCFSSGIPTPIISWKKDNHNLSKGFRNRVKFSQNNAVLSISSIQNEDSGTYICEAKNSVDTDRKVIKLEVSETGNNDERTKCSKHPSNTKESTSSNPSNPYAISTIVLGVAGGASVVAVAAKAIKNKKIPNLPNGVENIGKSIFNRLNSNVEEEDDTNDVEKQVEAKPNQSSLPTKTITTKTTTTYVNGEKQNTDTVVIEQEDDDADDD